MIFFLLQTMLAVSPVYCETRIPIANVTDSLQRKIPLKVLGVSPVNTVVSTLLLKFPLCKLAGVAERTTQIELMGAIGLTNTEMLRDCYQRFQYQLEEMENFELLWTSKMYIDDFLDVDLRFTENSSSNYGLRVDKVGFHYPDAAAKFINRWIESAMLKRVDKIIDPEELDPGTKMVILNAVHFKATWEIPFFTKERKFRTLDGKVSNVPMMVTLEEVLFLDYKPLDVKLVSITLVDCSMLLVVPSQANGLSTFLVKLNEDQTLMRKIKPAMKRKIISITMPKFKIKTYVDYTGFLKEVGVNQVFNKTHSGVNGLLNNSSQSSVHLSRVKQKVLFEVDEFGAMRHRPEGDISNLHELQYSSYMYEEVVLDRPFYFAVYFKVQGMDYDIFNGVYLGPDAV